MQNIESKSTRYRSKKQAVFDALYKCCERNNKDEVSLISVLQYITKEIDSNFKNSECIIKEVNQKLKDKSQNGWLSFVDVCEILNSWMDNISYSSQSGTAGNIFDAIDYFDQKQKCQQPLPLSSSIVKNNAIINGMTENTVCEVLFSKCEKCGRNENCCEWRNNEDSREEKIAQCYEQKVTELQNLLRQSEDFNSVIQLENESLRRENIIFRNKEKRWITKEEQLTEVEQLMSSTNTFLREQNANAEKEIQNLKQNLNQIKNENEKLVSENLLLEERVADKSRIEKLLVDTKVQQSEMQMDIHAKDALLAELEAKLEHLQQYNEILEAQISELQKSNSPVLSNEIIHEESLGEEMMLADLSDENPLARNNMVCLNIPSENSLKAELDACGQWSLLCENVAVQATPSVSTSATQTEENTVVPAICEFTESNSLLCHGKVASLRNHSLEGQQFEITEETERISTFLSNGSATCGEFSKQNSDFSAQSVQMQHESLIPFIPEKKSNVYVPFVQKNSHKRATRLYRSTYELELFIMVDAFTQTESLTEGGGNEDRVVDESHRHDLISKKQCIPVKPHTCAFLLYNSSCATSNCTVTCRTEMYVSSQSSTLATERIVTVMEAMRKEYCTHLNHLQQPCISLFNHSSNNALSVQLLFKKQYGNQTSLTKLFCCNDTPRKETRSVCWHAAMDTIARQTKQTSHCFQHCILQMLFVVIAWYLLQALIEFHEKHMWYNLSSFWSELHRVLADKMELHWPCGPPPQ